MTSEQKKMDESRGEAVAFGDNRNGQCQIPKRPEGSRYVLAAAGRAHSVLVRDDGEAISFGGESQAVHVPRHGFAAPKRFDGIRQVFV